MAVSKAQQKAVNKYMRENYDRVNLTMPKGRKEEIKVHSESRGESVNGFINRAISETMERDNAAPAAPQHASERALDILDGKYPMSNKRISRNEIKKAVEETIANAGTVTEFTDDERLEMVQGELAAIVDDFVKKVNREFRDWPGIIKMDDGTIRDMIERVITTTKDWKGLL